MISCFLFVHGYGNRWLYRSGALAFLQASTAPKGFVVGRLGLRVCGGIYRSGFLSAPGNCLSTGDQGDAVDSQQFSDAFTHDESFKLPALTKTKPGISSIWVNIWLPQRGQKPRLTWDPSLPKAPYCLNAPAMLTASSGKSTIVALPEPVTFWQSRQWQCNAAVDFS